MAKYLNRYNARMAVKALRESKAWIAKKSMLLETDEGDLEIKKGDQVVLGATEAGDLAIKDPQAVVIIADEKVATEVIDAIMNAEDLADVEFIDRPAVDAALEGDLTVDAVIQGLIDADEDAEEVEVAVVEPEDEKSVEEKIESIQGNAISSKDALVCERVYFAEEDEMMAVTAMEKPACEKDVVDNKADFEAKVRELDGSIQPGEKEVALNKEGKVVGYFGADEANPEMGEGVIFKCNCFDTTEEMDTFAAEEIANAPIVQEDAELADVDADEVDAAMGVYENSEKSAKDLFAFVEQLEKVGVKESAISNIVGSYVKRNLKEGVNVFDTKLGKVVATFAERVDADNYIAESGSEARFTKRFFG